jgi:hypothetical protein
LDLLQPWEGCNALACHNYCVSHIAVCRMVGMRSRPRRIIRKRAVKVQ